MSRWRRNIALCLSVLLCAQLFTFGVTSQPSYAAPANQDGEIITASEEAGEASEDMSSTGAAADNASAGSADTTANADAGAQDVADGTSDSVDANNASNTEGSADDSTSEADSADANDGIMLADEAGEDADGDGVDTQSVDTKSAGVCGITADGTTTYYLTLKEALEAVQSNQTIEIYKNCTLDEAVTLGGGTAGVTNVTIKNATDAAETADGTEYQNCDSVVTFTDAAEIVLGDATDSTKACTATVSGVKFDGKSTARNGRAFTVQGGSTLTVGTGADDDATALYGMYSNNDGAVFSITGEGSKVTFNSGTVSGCIAQYNYYSGKYPAVANDGNGGWCGGAVAALKESATFVLNGGTITKNGPTGSAANPWGSGPIYLQGTASFEMHGGAITENNGNHGGGISISGAVNCGTCPISIDGGELTNNVASSQGGAIYAGSETDKAGEVPTPKISITGNVTISGNKAKTAASAICIRAGSLTIGNGANGAAPTITNNSFTAAQAQVLDNGETRDYVQSAIGYTWSRSYYDKTTVDISGNTVISGNNNYAGEAANVYAFQSAGTASSKYTLKVHDLGAKANIGINTRYCTDVVGESGDQFAVVPTGGNANYTYRLVNDANPKLVGVVDASADASAVKWGVSSSGPLTLALKAAVSEPTWFTVEIKGAASAYRQAILLDPSKTDSNGVPSKTITVESFPLAYYYNISLVSEQSGWRYAKAGFTGSYDTNAEGESSADNFWAATGSASFYVGDLGCVNNTHTVSDAEGHSEIATRTLTITAVSDGSGGVLGRIAQWLSDTASVVNTMKE